MESPRTFFSDGRLFRISLAVIVAISLAVILTVKSDHSRESLITRGDFPGLFVQGVILSRGEAPRLYDFEYQRKIENEIWPSFNGGLYVSVYPPYHAFLMRPFANFDAFTAQIIFTAVMLGALLITLLIIIKLNPTSAPALLPMSAIALTFPPLFFGVLGAQNTALSMLLYAIVLIQSRKSSNIGDFTAGLALGAWLFKPQFALIGIAFALIMWRRWMLVGISLVAAIYYYLATSISGPLWVLEWIKSTSVFAVQNYVVNGSQMTSLIATIKMVLISLGIAPESETFATYSLIAHTIILLLLAFLLTRAVSKKLLGELNTYQMMLYLGPAIALFSPNTLFYDLGIPLVTLLTASDFATDRSFWRGLIIWSALGALVALRGVLSVPLFFLFPIFVGWHLSTRLRPRS